MCLLAQGWSAVWSAGVCSFGALCGVRGPAARREQRLVRGAVVMLGEPVRALVAAPLVEERCVGEHGGRRVKRQRGVVRERAWVRTHAPLSSEPWCGARLLG